MFKEISNHNRNLVLIDQDNISSLQWLYFLFFSIAVILLPFNDLPYFKDFLHELSGEGTFYPLTIGLLIWLFCFCIGKKISIPRYNSFVFLLLFTIWIFISTISNFQDISLASFKARSGFEKNILQIILFLYMALIPVFIYDISKNREKQFLKAFRNCILISFIIAGFYSFFELLFLFGVSKGTLLISLNEIVRGNPSLYYGRLRSVSGEASWFGIYCAFIFPWLLSYIYTAKNKKRWLFYAINFYLVFLIVMTFSRTAYFIAFIQISLFLLFCFRFGNPKDKKVIVMFSILLIFILVSGFFLTPIFSDYFLTKGEVFAVFSSIFNLREGEFRQSNIARFGSQVAALKIGVDHPFFGIGLGQYGFYLLKYVPEWALSDREIKIWLADVGGTPWPPVHSLYARIIGELGFVGLILWFLMWFSFFINTYKIFRIKSLMQKGIDYISLSIMISAIGMFMAGFSSDSFRLFGYWFILGVGWVHMRFFRNFNEQEQIYEDHN